MGADAGMSGPGPRVRTDVVDVYVFRTSTGAGDSTPATIELLQLLRAKEPSKGDWHPIMGHIEAGERAQDTALRELEQEVGLSPDNAAFRGLWALEQVHPFFFHERDAIMLSPRFAARVSRDWAPTLDAEHTDHRWILWPAESPQHAFVWPGQSHAADEILTCIADPTCPAHKLLRIR